MIERVRGFFAQSNRDARTTMTLALIVWLCTLPLIFLVVTPFLGWQVAGLAALGLLLFLLPICWVLCLFRIARGGGRS